MYRFPRKETLLETFQWRIEESCDDIAFKFNDEEMTYREYDQKGNQVANGIISEGCIPNSRVAVLAKNSVMYAEILFGSIKSRTALVGLNWRLAGPEVVFVVNDSESELLFVGPDFYQLVDSIKDEFGSGMCNITRCCTDVCPEHIQITDNAIIPMKERVVDRYYDPIARLFKKLFSKNN